jgi:hypothetical protein
VKSLLLTLPLAAVLLASCGSAKSVNGGNGGIYRHATPSKTTTRKPQSKPPKTVTSGYDSAPWVASQYVSAEYGLNWQHLTSKRTHFAEWSMLAKKYATSALWSTISASQEASLKQGGNGSPIPHWVSVHRMEYVDVLHSGVMAQAGVTPTSEIVQVTFAIQKTGLDLPQETTGATQVVQLGMQKVSGKWLVAKQYAYPVG